MNLSDPDTKETLLIHEFAGIESLIGACTQLPCRELILMGKAKALFAGLMAAGLNHPNAGAWIDKWPIVKGYRTAAWEEGNAPTYLGMGASRVWFGGTQAELEEMVHG